MKNDNKDQNNVFSFFTGLDKLINVVVDMVDNEKDEVYMQGEIKSDQKKKVIGKYGLNVKLGTDKQGSIHNFKFEDKVIKKDNLPKVIVPVTDVFEEEDKVTIVSELPGVEKDDVALIIEQNTITFTAIKKEICYSKKVVLDFIPEYSSIKESFHNSIYSVMIMKKHKHNT